MTDTFFRLTKDDPAKRDPSCLGKAAIAKALLELDYLDIEFFRRGLRYRQLEPVWGGSVDTAVEVRCHCAMGLAASGYPRALVDLAELLADEAPAARQAAAKALLDVNPNDKMRARLAQALARRAGQTLTLNALLKKSPA